MPNAYRPSAPQFAQEVQERGAALSAQTAATAAANPARRELNMYIRHFIGVFNMGVDRGRYLATDRAHYQLPVDYHQLPKLGTDFENILWANNIVSGDAARVLAAGQPMENPTAAEVAAKLTDLNTALAAQSPAKDAYDKEQEDVAALRASIDDLIADIWDEVLFEFRKDDAPSMRRKAREYGVVYRLSAGEAPAPEEFSVQGSVTAQDAAGVNAPLSDVEITVIETNDAVMTDATGNYLIPLLPDGNYNLQFKIAGYATQTLPVTVAVGGIITVDVVMVADVPPMP
ncbi:MAG: carboxypeptidase regulatory-like domain-containing protein [Flavobacteriales bacterium]|nr:carboxypeptidase regulatory-like domain-containing protein [Flavobacteriales bacterium]